MAVLSVDVLFDAAVRIQLAERSISITFSYETIRIKFPTTRRLAEFLEVPHYYVLPYFAMMEQEELGDTRRTHWYPDYCKGESEND